MANEESSDFNIFGPGLSSFSGIIDRFRAFFELAAPLSEADSGGIGLFTIPLYKDKGSTLLPAFTDSRLLRQPFVAKAPLEFLKLFFYSQNADFFSFNSSARVSGNAGAEVRLDRQQLSLIIGAIETLACRSGALSGDLPQGDAAQRFPLPLAPSATETGKGSAPARHTALAGNLSANAVVADADPAKAAELALAQARAHSAHYLASLAPAGLQTDFIKASAFAELDLYQDAYDLLKGDKSPRALCLLAEIHRRTGNQRNARELLSSIPQNAGQDRKKNLETAWLELEEGKTIEAQRMFGTAAAAGDDRQEALFGLAMAAAGAASKTENSAVLNEAAAVFEAALENPSKMSARIFFYAGNFFLRSGLAARAEVCYRESARLSPSLQVRANLTLALLKGNKLEEAAATAAELALTEPASAGRLINQFPKDRVAELFKNAFFSLLKARPEPPAAASPATDARHTALAGNLSADAVMADAGLAQAIQAGSTPPPLRPAAKKYPPQAADNAIGQRPPEADSVTPRPASEPAEPAKVGQAGSEVTAKNSPPKKPPRPSDKTIGREKSGAAPPAPPFRADQAGAGVNFPPMSPPQQAGLSRSFSNPAEYYTAKAPEKDAGLRPKRRDLSGPGADAGAALESGAPEETTVSLEAAAPKIVKSSKSPLRQADSAGGARRTTPAGNLSATGGRADAPDIQLETFNDIMMASSPTVEETKKDPFLSRVFTLALDLEDEFGGKIYFNAEGLTQVERKLRLTFFKAKDNPQEKLDTVRDCSAFLCYVLQERLKGRLIKFQDFDPWGWPMIFKRPSKKIISYPIERVWKLLWHDALPDPGWLMKYLRYLEEELNAAPGSRPQGAAAVRSKVMSHAEKITEAQTEHKCVLILASSLVETSHIGTDRTGLIKLEQILKNTFHPGIPPTADGWKLLRCYGHLLAEIMVKDFKTSWYNVEGNDGLWSMQTPWKTFIFPIGKIYKAASSGENLVEYYDCLADEKRRYTA